PPHRLQPVASGGGVEWVNDSKATNPDATIKALTAFEGGVHLILGGSLKGGSFAALARAVAAGPVTAAYLIGAASDAIAAALDAAGAAYIRCETLERAVAEAAAAARTGRPGGGVRRIPTRSSTTCSCCSRSAWSPSA